MLSSLLRNKFRQQRRYKLEFDDRGVSLLVRQLLADTSKLILSVPVVDKPLLQIEDQS